MAGLLFKNFTNMITLCNLLFGSISILYTVKGEFGPSAVFIILAVLMDSMDGRLARRFHTTSELGKELDSLCDLVSFGVAPAILLYTQVFANHVGYIALTAIILTLLYIICGALRLARFNVLNNHEFFMGIPITLAGAFMAVISLFLSHLSAPLILFIILVLALLMVSNIRVPKL
ncbi:MAG TPA: CDP-diacylglycerol--serine O-phosphatidyltransferase [Syntrophomonadaceae bacterium]|nr:CDP-diacylglycerol--serine O-phosphatidyltransferase [Syntrophomonadaceae bacterium]